MPTVASVILDHGGFWCLLLRSVSSTALTYLTIFIRPRRLQVPARRGPVFMGIPEGAVDLGKNLLVVEVGPGNHARRAGRHARAAALAQGLITRLTFFSVVELDGVVGAHVVANPAAGAALFVDRGHDRLDHHLRPW